MTRRSGLDQNGFLEKGVLHLGECFLQVVRQLADIVHAALDIGQRMLFVAVKDPLCTNSLAHQYSVGVVMPVVGLVFVVT